MEAVPASGTIAFLYFIGVLLLLYMTFWYSKRIAPSVEEAEKEEVYACGERKIEPPPRLYLSYFRYVLIFMIFDAVPVLSALAVSFARPLTSLEYLSLATYLGLSTLAVLVVVRR